MKLDFINRIWIKGNGKISGLRKILFGCAVLLLLISFVQFLLGGMKEVSWFTGIVLPIVMLIYYRLNYNTDGYMSVRCTLKIENDGFHVYYYDVDYHDGNGTHTEHIYIPYGRVLEFQYSKELVSFRILSKPIVTLHNKENEIIKDYNIVKNMHTCILYPPADKIDHILKCIQDNNFISVTYMDDKN